MKRIGMNIMGQTKGTWVLVLFGMFGVAFSVGALAAVNADAAITLAKQNACLKCHNYTKEQQAAKPKDGKPWYEVAAKYKGKADAEATLLTHINTGPKTKFPDGHEEEHKIIKTKDEAQQKNLVNWVLSLQ
ncbi:MAG TPA: c-type cytochrome [Gallionella sp.]|nr:c-type cytochrome [Gallionella sp.]